MKKIRYINSIVLETVFAVSCLFFSLGQLIKINVFKYQSKDVLVMPLEIIIFILFISLMIRYFSMPDRRKRLSRHLKDALPFIWFGVFMALSAVFGFFHLKMTLRQAMVSLLYLFRWWLFLIVFFSVLSLAEDKTRRFRLILYFGLACIVWMGLGIFQYARFPAMAQFSEQLNLLLAAVNRIAGRPVLKIFSFAILDHHEGRLFGSFMDPNFTGMYVNLLIAVALGAVIAVDYKYKIIPLLFLPFLFFVLMKTTSRGAMLTFIFTGLAFLALLNIFVIKTLKTRLVIVAGCLVAFFIGGAAIWNTSMMQRIRDTFKELSTTNVEIGTIKIPLNIAAYDRFISWEKGFQMMNDNPFIGVGYNNIPFAWHRYGERLAGHTMFGIDSSWLLIAACTGILGLFLFFSAHIYLLRLCWRNIRFHQTPVFIKSISYGFFLVFVVFLINANFINGLFYPHIMYFFWFCAGFIVIGARLRKARK